MCFFSIFTGEAQSTPSVQNETTWQTQNPLEQLQALFEYEKKVLSRKLEMLEEEHALRKNLTLAQIRYYESISP